MCLEGDFASGAAEQTKPGCDVWRPIKPAESNRLCSLSAWHRLGPRARRAKQATTVTMAFRGRRWCSTCQCVAPAGPASPTGSGGCRATSFHPWFFFSSFFLRGSGTVGNMIPETATEQSILEIASSLAAGPARVSRRTASQISLLRLVMNKPTNTFRPYPYYFPYEQAFPDEDVSVGDTFLRRPRGSSPYDASLPWPTGSWKQSAVLDASDPAVAICLAAREGNLQFLSEQPQAILLLDGNGDSITTHAVDSGKMSSLEFLLRLPFCVHTLLNVPSRDARDGNYPLMAAVTNNRVECAARLLAAGARIMVPVNHFEDSTVTPTSMMHQIIYYPDAGRDDAGGDRLPLLAMMLWDLTNPKTKYSWAQQVSILLFRTIVGEDKLTHTHRHTGTKEDAIGIGAILGHARRSGKECAAFRAAVLKLFQVAATASAPSTRRRSRRT